MTPARRSGGASLPMTAHGPIPRRTGPWHYGPMEVPMTELLEKAVAVARELPPRSQDKIARIILAASENDEEPYVLTPEEEEAVAEGREAAARGEFATDEQMAALWTKFEV